MIINISQITQPQPTPIDPLIEELKLGIAKAGPRGPTGFNIELQATDDFIQWRIADGEADWEDLVPLSELTGPSLELRSTMTELQWRVEGDVSWQTLVLLSAIKGNDGATPTFTPGTITTLAPGASATISLTGTPPNYVLNLGIPAGAQGVPGPGGTLDRTAVTSAMTIGASLAVRLFDCSGTFTVGIAAAATIGAGGYFYIRNTGTGDVTIDPNASETIDGLTSFIMYPGECRIVQCDGTVFRSIILTPFLKSFSTSGNFIKPPGYPGFELHLAAGSPGGGGGYYSSIAVINGGSAGTPARYLNIPFIKSADVSASTTVTIGAAGAAGANGPNVNDNGTNGGVGGTTSFGTYSQVGTGGAGIGATNAAPASAPTGATPALLRTGAIDFGSDNGTTGSSTSSPAIGKTIPFSPFQTAGKGGDGGTGRGTSNPTAIQPTAGVAGEVVVKGVL